MAVIRITIKKKLEDGAYAGHVVVKREFTSDYLVHTGAAFDSAHLKQWAHRIALAESRLYPPCVLFEEALLRLVTPGMMLGESRRPFSYAGFDDLKGTLEMGEGEMLAYPPVSAVFGRQAIVGRHGRSVMPHILTTTEWNLYAQKQVSPPRFQTADHAQTAFCMELLGAIQNSGDAYVMAGGEGDTQESLRRIVSFYFYDFQVDSLKKKRRSKATTRRVANAHAALPKVPVEGVVYMLQSGGFFKIGKSINPNKRLSQIKLQLPQAATVVHVIRALHPSKAESHWHRRFAARRLNGE